MNVRMTIPLTPQQPRLGGELQTSLQWSHDRTFSGFVVDPADPGRKFIVELLVDGYPVKCMRAADHVDALANDEIGDGCYGFSFSLADSALDEAAVVEVRVANLGTAIGEPVFVRALVSSGHGSSSSSSGAVRWLGGLRFAGWVAEGGDPVVDILVDGERINQIRASGWSHIGNTEDACAVRALDFHLPERFADGTARRVAAMNAKGEHLEGSPLPFVAYADGLERAVAGSAAAHSEALRSAMFDRLVPMSVPFVQYQRWRGQLPAATVGQCGLKAAVIVVGPGEMDDTLASLNAQDHADWVAASLPETADYGGFDNAAALAFLAGDGAEADVVVFLPSGALLNANALTRMSAAFIDHRHAAAVYGDVDIAGGDGSLWPLAFPAFDYERMLEQGYCAHAFALRRPVAEQVLDGGASNLYRVFNAVLDDGMKVAEAIIHLPGAVATLPSIDLDAAARTLAAATAAHLRRRGSGARVTVGQGRVLPAVKAFRTFDKARVTIVIPTRNRHELLKACIDSIKPALHKRDYELLVVDNDSSDPATLDYLASIDDREARVLRIAGDFNFARLNNLAAAAASSEFLCLLNNDVQALDGDWLDEMLGRMSAADVGAVGALLLWPSGVVQHGGVVLGSNFAAAHAFNDRIDGDAGYGDLLRVAHQCSAVTAACLLTRRQDYLDVGGMDEFRFPVNFNDVDYCLKLRAAGKRVVFTPHAQLLHLESASRGTDRQADRKARFERELHNLRAKWADVLTADPFYNPALSLDPVPFSALAWPLRSMQSRTSAAPHPVTVPPGF
jgi:GT2 family glycosyltransferase